MEPTPTHGGGHQTVPLARLSEENLGVGAEETGKATYKERRWDESKAGSAGGPAQATGQRAGVRTLLRTLPRARGPSAH